MGTIEEHKKGLIQGDDKKKILLHQFQELNKEKMKSSKIKNVNYTSVKTQEYLKSDTLTDEAITNVFKYRTHMLEFDENYKSRSDSTKLCSLCKSHPDSQDSMEDCVYLKAHFRNLHKLKNLYEENFEDEAAEMLTKVLALRSKSLGEQIETNSNDES